VNDQHEEQPDMRPRAASVHRDRMRESNPIDTRACTRCGRAVPIDPAPVEVRTNLEFGGPQVSIFHPIPARSTCGPAIRGPGRPIAIRTASRFK